MANDENLISTIGIGVKVDTEKAVKQVDALTASLKNLGEVKGASLNKNLAGRVSELADALQKFQTIGKASPLNMFDRLATSIQKLAGASKISISKVLPDRITAIGDSLKSLHGVDLTPLERLADALVKIGTVTDAKIPKITGLSNATKAVNSIAKDANMGKVSKNGETASGGGRPPMLFDLSYEEKRTTSAQKIAELQDRMVSLKGTVGALADSLDGRLANGLKKAGAGFASLIKNIAVAPFKKLASAISGAVKRLTGFLSAIKRIALYRAIRTALKEITQGFREGMQNLYQYSLLINGTFKDSMDSLATSALYLKNSLGAMVAPIVNALAPAVDYLVDKFVDLLNTFNELIATLTGASTWTKAIKYPTQYAEATDNASGSAKKLRATLLGFDEINRLDDNSKGGRGSGGDQLDYSKMFEEQAVSEMAKAWGDKIRNAFLGEGDSLGAVIGEVINNAVDNYTEWVNRVDWRGVGESIGTNLSDAIKKTDSKKIGNALASTVNAGFKSLNGFVSKVDWDEFGKFIADGINGFFDGIGTKDIAESISKGIGGALKMSASFLTTLDVQKIGDKVGQLLKDLKWDDIFNGLGEAISALIKTKNDLWKAGRTIMDGILSALLSAIRELPAFGEKIIRSIISGIKDHLVDVFQEALKIGDKVFEGIESWFTKLKEKGGKQMIIEIINGIKEKLSEILEWGKKIGKEFLKGIKEGLKDSSLINNIKKVLENTVFTRGGIVNSTFTILEGDADGKALGGSVTTGDLFYANEHEPELIAHVGNRTQVANNDQITESIRLATQQGNAESNMLLREAVSLLGGILAKDNTSVTEITASSITDGLRRQNLRNGRTTVAVG